MRKRYIPKVFIIMIIIVIAAIIAISFFVAHNLGNANNVELTIEQSDIYNRDEIEDAMKTVKNDFKKNFINCKLNRLSYEDQINLNNKDELAKQYNVKEIIILESEFYVRPGGGDGSLEDNRIHSNYSWILGRNSSNEAWEVKDTGYL